MRFVVGVLLWLVTTVAHTEPPQHSDLLCMATNIFFEARGEPIKGQLAVRDVTNNRGSDTCAVVFKRKQFSWTHQIPWHVIESFLLGTPKLNEIEYRAWVKAQWIATAPVRVLPEGYTHYHALSAKPRWTKRGIVIGNHKYMRGVK